FTCIIRCRHTNESKSAGSARKTVHYNFNFSHLAKRSEKHSHLAFICVEVKVSNVQFLILLIHLSLLQKDIYKLTLGVRVLQPNFSGCFSGKEKTKTRFWVRFSYLKQSSLCQIYF